MGLTERFRGMTEVDSHPSSSRTRWVLPVILVILAALVMGLPTLRGGFVGGDDHRLVLNHVLVSRPSLAHALELFRILHRESIDAFFSHMIGTQGAT